MGTGKIYGGGGLWLLCTYLISGLDAMYCGWCLRTDEL